MAKQQPIEMFMPPNVLKAKVGSGGFDAAMLKRAEKAIDSLKEEFADWLATDVARLVEAREAFERKRSAASFDTLFRASHDLKGQGTTYDFPLVARIAASLCALTDNGGDGAAVPMTLIDAHVDAIKAIVRDGIKDASDPTANVLAQELENQVSAFLQE